MPTTATTPKTFRCSDCDEMAKARHWVPYEAGRIAVCRACFVAREKREAHVTPKHPLRTAYRDLRHVPSPEVAVHGLVAISTRGHVVGAIGCAPGRTVEPFDDVATDRLFHSLVHDMRDFDKQCDGIGSDYPITFYADLGGGQPDRDEVVVYPATRDLTERMEDDQDPPVRILETPYGLVADTDKPVLLWASVKSHRLPKTAKSVYIHRAGQTYGEGPSLYSALSDASVQLGLDGIESLAYIDRDRTPADDSQFYFSII